MITFSTTFWNMLCEMAPYLLLGFLIAGLLHAFVPSSVYYRHLSRPTMGSVMKSALFGVPLPLCSCGVIPTAMSLRNEGASRGATVSFLISTPQTGVDSIAATYSMMGLPFAVLRPVAAFVTAIFGGAVSNRADRGQACRRDGDPVSERQMRYASLRDRLVSALRYGFVEMMHDIGRWLVIGLVIAALITVLVPAGFLASLAAYPLLSMLLVLAISVPMYVCATGSIPIAVALIAKGLSPGAALVLLMAGPATNAASLLMVYKVLGRTTTMIYVGAIVIGSMVFGLLIDYVLPEAWFYPVTNTVSACCAADTMAGWFPVVCGSILSVLLIFAFLSKDKYDHHIKNIDDMRTFKIDGMMCNHCRANVEKAILAIPGITTAEVDLSKGLARVQGTAGDEKIISAVKALGYECHK